MTHTKRFEISKVDNGYIVTTWDHSKELASTHQCRVYEKFDDVHNLILAFFTKELAEEVEKDTFI